MTGTRIGPYEILGPLGVGGMGEVYRARDTKLNRDVAIKALPDLFAKDAERVARFEREAQLLAALNHPHIAAIYGLEEAEGAKFLVLELVEGQSLAERLAGAHALRVAEALSIARQVALALEAAHGTGIIHRDLKPGNIMIQGGSHEADDISAKVLDFGLGIALDPSGSGSQANDNAKSPTLTFAATQLGVILGTAAYMAPEQARGRAADKRADVWAFGCVLYEMVTGRTRIKAFVKSPTRENGWGSRQAKPVSGVLGDDLTGWGGAGHPHREGQRVIRVEQRRRGVEDPVERAMRAGRQDDRAAIASVRAKSAPLYSRDSPRTLASA